MSGCETDLGTVFGMIGKKPERKRKNLIRMGISQNQTYAWSRTKNEEGIHEYR